MAAFRELDADGDGQVSSIESELRKIQTFALPDANGDKMFERNEVGLDSDPFRALDRNGDGAISGLEFVGSRSGQLSTCDSDGDGAPTFNELVGFAASSSAAEP